MAEWSPIEWCDSTVNPEMGCDGCELWNPRTGVRRCYAGTLTERRTKHGPVRGWPPAFDRPTIFPGRIAQAAKWKDLAGTRRPDKPWLDGLPRLVFLDDMGDTFTEALRLDWLAEELPVIAASPHRWLLLTKRPHRAAEFAGRHPLPPNLWIGTSVTDQPTVARIERLLGIEAAVRFVSVEPLGGLVDLRPYLAGLHWVILGGESGSGAPRVDLAWARAIRDRCVAAGVPFFFKQWGGRTPKAGGRRLDGREWNEMPTCGAGPEQGRRPAGEGVGPLFDRGPW